MNLTVGSDKHSAKSPRFLKPTKTAPNRRRPTLEARLLGRGTHPANYYVLFHLYMDASVLELAMK